MTMTMTMTRLGLTAALLASCGGGGDPVLHDAAVPQDAAAPQDAADARPPVVAPFEWTGILGTGQSLSVGIEGIPRSHAVTRFHNLSLSDPRDNAGGWSGIDAGIEGLTVVPLSEPSRRFVPNGAAGYPNNLGGETPHTAMADDATALTLAAGGPELVTVHSIVGMSGRALADLGPAGATNSYAAALYEAEALTALAHSAGKTFGYGAIVMTHGETDQANADYEAQVYALLQTYNRDLRAITGQTTSIPMLISQQSSLPWPEGAADPQRSAATLAQWKLGVDHPGEVYCVGPKYQYPSSIAVIHLSAEGYRRLGMKNAEVFVETVVLHHDWAPLQPTAAHLAGKVVTIDFHVPHPPLQWDLLIPPPHQAGTPHAVWANGRGFEVADSTGELAIESVQISGSEVLLALQNPPSGSGLVVRYAMTPERFGWSNGPQTGRRGQLRDSDPVLGDDLTSIPSVVTPGSTVLTAAAGASFDALGEREQVTNMSGGIEAVVVHIDPPASLTLSAPWPGPSGQIRLDVGGRSGLHTAVTTGSTEATPWGFDVFAEIEAGDRVSGTGAPVGMTVASVAPRNRLTLSSPWTGAGGSVALAFRSEQRNYCVQFELAVQ